MLGAAWGGGAVGAGITLLFALSGPTPWIVLGLLVFAALWAVDRRAERRRTRGGRRRRRAP